MATRRRLCQDQKGGYCQILLLNARCRLGTFLRHNWKGGPGISERDLANAGFFVPLYHKGSAKNEVECIFCEVRISGWTLNDDPFLRHLRVSPNCPFVLGHEVANTGLEENEPSRYVRTIDLPPDFLKKPFIIGTPNNLLITSLADDSGPYGPFKVPLFDTKSPRTQSTWREASTSRAAPSIGVVHRPPVHELFLIMGDRLKTFPPNWPQRIARKLAEAGFFVLNEETKWLTTANEQISDLVTCFSCGLKVFGWNEEDPWQVHHRLKPDCYFLTLGILHKDGPPKLSQKVVEVPKKVTVPRHISGICTLCQRNEIDVLVIPCHEASFCTECYEELKLKDCPNCNTEIKDLFKFYLS